MPGRKDGKTPSTGLLTRTRPADTNQVLAGFFVHLSAQPTRPATLHSEFPKAHEYNSNCVVRALKVRGDYQCLILNESGSEIAQRIHLL